MGDNLPPIDLSEFGAPGAIVVAIDIKPGSEPNKINPNSGGFVRVAILTTDDFDTITVDPLTVRFGPLGADTGERLPRLKDVNHDGLIDLLFHFRFEFIPLWGFAVVLLYAMRRVNCRRCGVKVEAVPWAMGKHGLTQAYMLFLAHWARKLSWTET